MGRVAALAQLSEDMGLYFEHVQTWLDVANLHLAGQGKRSRFYEVLGLDPTPDILPMLYEVNVMDRQLAVFVLAIGAGCEFEFEDDKEANSWLCRFIQNSTDNHVTALSDYLTSEEVLKFKVSNW